LFSLYLNVKLVEISSRYLDNKNNLFAFKTELLKNFYRNPFLL